MMAMNIIKPDKLRLISRTQNLGHLHILYKVKFNTYKTYLSNAPINICIINKNGDSILETIVIEHQKEDAFEHTFTAPYLNEVESLLLCSGNNTIQLNSVDINVSNDKDNGIMDAYYFPYFENMDKSTNYTAVLISSSKLSNQKEMFDEEYASLKSDIRVKASQLTLLGAITYGLLGETHDAMAFGIGGTIGLVYLMMLQRGVDRNESFALRLGAVGVLSYISLAKYHVQISDDHFLFLHGLLGFSIYRIAMIAAFMQNKE